MKKDSIYFENFAEAAGMACKMARKLNDFLQHFDPANLESGMRQVHDIEHEADNKKHELMEALVRAFVTPIDRDELISISQNIDDVLDAMDDIMIHLYIAQVKQLRADTLEFSELVVRCCDATAKLMEEFRDFKKSKIINDLIVEINQLEEEGDRMYIEAMKTLYTVSADPMEVIAWREIYGAFENVCDQCEDVADIVETIIIGNL